MVKKTGYPTAEQVQKDIDGKQKEIDVRQNALGILNQMELAAAQRDGLKQYVETKFKDSPLYKDAILAAMDSTDEELEGKIKPLLKEVGYKARAPRSNSNSRGSRTSTGNAGGRSYALPKDAPSKTYAGLYRAGCTGSELAKLLGGSSAGALANVKEGGVRKKRTKGSKPQHDLVAMSKILKIPKAELPRTAESKGVTLRVDEE